MRRFQRVQVRLGLIALALATLAGIEAGPMAADASATGGPGGVTITCSLHVHYPHGSTHVGGTNNVVADVTCDAPVPAISMNVGLRDLTNDRAHYSGVETDWNTAYSTGNAALPCQPGTYQGVATATVIFPVGFQPSVETAEAASVTRSLTCSNATFDAGSHRGLTTSEIAPVSVQVSATYDPARRSAANDPYVARLVVG